MGVCGWLHHFGGWTVLPGRIIIGAGWDTAGPIKCAVTCAGRNRCDSQKLELAQAARQDVIEGNSEV